MLFLLLVNDREERVLFLEIDRIALVVACPSAFRYKEDLWKPVFEKQKRIQANRGRSLDPFYTFRF